LSIYIRKFRSYLRKNETARGLFLVGIVILGAIAIWGGIRLALNTEYPILVVSSGSMCQRLNPTLHNSACTLEIGALIVIRGVDPNTISNGTIIIFRPNPNTPDYLVVHRVVKVFPANQNTPVSFWTEGDANGALDGWDNPTYWSNVTQGVPGNLVVGVYQLTIPIPYLGATILNIRSFMYDDNTGQPKTQGILVIVALIVALFAFEVAEPGKKKLPSNDPEETKTSAAPTNVLPPGRHRVSARRSSPSFSG
jgi:signal peptidase I